MMMSELAWYLVYTEPMSEMTAAKRLVRQGFDCFVPNLILELRRRQRRIQRTRPLFPSYIFLAQQSGEGRWSEIEDTRGVVELVKIEGAPLRIPQKAVDALSNKMAAGGYREDEDGTIRWLKTGEIVKKEASFEVGDVVRVIDGPFASFNAIVEQVAEQPKPSRRVRKSEVAADPEGCRRWHVWASVLIFGRPTLAEFEWEQVEPI
jgi:transcriptional antiterminator RfaH